MDDLTIVVPYYNGEQHIGRLVNSLPPDVQIVVVDDHSDEPLTQDMIGARRVQIYRPEQKGYFTGAVNYGIARCDTDVLILNQDVVLSGTAWLDLIAERRDRYALIGERIKGNHPAFPLGYVHGVFQFMRRDAIDRVGAMDAEMYPLWGASAMWLWSICRAGFEALPVERVPGLVHREPSGFGDSIRSLLKREPDKRATLIRTPPEVSVVVPNYNHGRYLGELVDSLTRQTFSSFEIILQDDASTDDSRAIMQDLANPWTGVRAYRSGQNEGTAAALNRAIRQAAGRYICVTAADDMREPWSLRDLYETLHAHPHHFAYDDPIIYINGIRDRVMALGQYDPQRLPRQNHVHAGIMYPVQAWQQAGGYPEALRAGREDWGFNLALLQQGWCGAKTKRPGYIYRRHRGNRTNTNTSQEWLSRFAYQMRAMYPGLYNGETAVCCGRKMATVNQASAPTRAAVPAAADMVLIEYMGRAYGVSTWGGPGATASGQSYTFDASDLHRKKYIFRQDWPWFADLGENGERLFRLVEQKAEPIGPSPDSMTVAEIRELTLSPDQWAALAKAEKAGKGRKTVIEYAQEQIND